MKRIYPAHLLNELLQNSTDGDVIEITVRKLNKFNTIGNMYNVDMRHCYFEDIEDFVNQIVFSKHQSVIGYNKIYVLNCKELRSRINNYTDMYDTVDTSFIYENWEKI